MSILETIMSFFGGNIKEMGDKVADVAADHIDNVAYVIKEKTPDHIDGVVDQVADKATEHVETMIDTVTE